MSEDTLIRRTGLLLLEHRYRYYVLDAPTISDRQYDLLERDYERLCREAGVPPVHCDMVGYDYSKPDAQAVADKLNRPKT